MREWLTPRRQTAILGAIVTFVALQTLINDTAIAEVLFSVALVSIMITALYAICINELVGKEAAFREERRRNGVLGVHSQLLQLQAPGNGLLFFCDHGVAMGTLLDAVHRIRDVE